ncbi:TetR-like C-terminal domain-containing protein, partial [Glaciihabitans sp. dw_435]|uniref:TetR-like C-terminal domain-containing protein n=1 Tax=Glaciihabitans sp. dw_435 TaxID=2720081 RepID=UPI001BD4EE47
DRVSAAVAGRSGRDAVAGLFEAHRRFARELPGRWTALQRPAHPTTVKSESAMRVAELMLAVLRQYDLPERELVHATRLLGATLNGFVTLEAAGSFGHRDPDTELSWTRAIDVLDAALRAWPTTTPEVHR